MGAAARRASGGRLLGVLPPRVRRSGAAGDPAWAAVALVRGEAVDDEQVVPGAAGAPYTPGLMALRVGPLLERAVRALGSTPDVLLLDGTGRDHPRRAGLALQLGAELDVPTVGVTHRPLLATGSWPAGERGASAPLRIDGEPVSAWLRTRPGTRPLAVHPGWRTDLDTAVEVVLRATTHHRTPEPLRLARHRARMERHAYRK